MSGGDRIDAGIRKFLETEVKWEERAPPDMAARSLVVPDSVMGATLIVPRDSAYAPALRNALTIEQRGPRGQQYAPREFFDEREGWLVAPRFAWLRAAACIRPFADARRFGESFWAGGRGPAGAVYNVSLLPYQRASVRAIHRFYGSVGGCHIVVPCGFGKSHIGGAAIASVGVRAVVLVFKLDQMDQMCRTLRAAGPSLWAACVGDKERWPPRRMTAEEMRACGAAEDDPHPALPDVVVSTAQSFALGIMPREARMGIGHVVVDEVHHVPANIMKAVMEQLPAARVLGMTATDWRSDDCEVTISDFVGPLAIRVIQPWRPAVMRCLQFRVAEDTVRAIDRQRGLKIAAGARADTTLLLANDARRNRDILRTVAVLARRLRARKPCGTVLVMVDSRRHAIELCRRVAPRKITDTIDRRQAAAERRRREAAEERGVLETLVDCEPRFDLGGDEAKLWEGLSVELYVGVVMTRAQRVAAKHAEASVYFATGSVAFEGLDLRHIHAVAIFCRDFGKEMTQPVGRGRRINTQHGVPEYYIGHATNVRAIRASVRNQQEYFEERERWPVQCVDATDLRTLARPPTAEAGDISTTPFVAKRRRRRDGGGGGSGSGSGKRAMLNITKAVTAAAAAVTT